MVDKPEDTTTNKSLNLPLIGGITNWASQYRENFKKLDTLLKGISENKVEKNSVVTDEITHGLEDGNDIKSNRSANTIYQNTAGTNLLVAVERRIDGSSGSQTMIVRLNSSPSDPPDDFLDSQDAVYFSGQSNDTRSLLTAVVPDGHYYQLFADSGDESSTVRWMERRFTQ